ncbi:MAG: cytochrome c-type biogenesis protein CcmH [Acidobacteria bacterium]|nr:cytochrome c-type biogenesis protein CcmH [Acidobacteriota bacterium]
MKCRNLCRLGTALILSLLWALAAPCSTSSDAALIRDIENNLIAPCCWTQPISQHESSVSEQMREEVRTMVAAGMSREEILDHFVARYGERILATPRPEGFNRLVYILPWVALAFGVWLLFVLLKKLRTPASASSPAPAPDDRYASLIEKELKELEEK